MVKKMNFVTKLFKISPRRAKFVGDKQLTCPFTGNKYNVTIICGVVMWFSIVV